MKLFWIFKHYRSEIYCILSTCIISNQTAPTSTFQIAILPDNQREEKPYYNQPLTGKERLSTFSVLCHVIKHNLYLFTLNHSAMKLKHIIVARLAALFA